MGAVRAAGEVILSRHAAGETLVDEQVKEATITFSQIESALESEIDAALVIPGARTRAWSAGLAAMDCRVPPG
jgi:hypothetical protein